MVGTEWGDLRSGKEFALKACHFIDCRQGNAQIAGSNSLIEVAADNSRKQDFKQKPEFAAEF